MIYEKYSGPTEMKLILIRDRFFYFILFFLENGEYTFIHSCIHSFESNDSSQSQTPAPSLTSSATLGKFLNFSRPQFPYVYSGDNNGEKKSNTCKVLRIVPGM